MDDNRITILLSTEELLFLLRQLGLPTLPGLGADPFQGIDEERMKYVVSSAYHSLLARNYIAVSEMPGEIILDRTIMALILTCGMAPKVLMISNLSGSSRPIARYFHFGSDLTVAHANPDTNIHEFVAMVEPSDVSELITDTLRLTELPYLNVDITLPQTDFDNVINAIKSNHINEAQELLFSFTDSKQAIAIVQSIQQINGNLVVGFVRKGDQQEQYSGDGFSLLISPLGILMLVNPSQNNTELVNLNIQGVQLDQIRQRINVLIN